MGNQPEKKTAYSEFASTAKYSLFCVIILMTVSVIFFIFNSCSSRTDKEAFRPTQDTIIRELRIISVDSLDKARLKDSLIVAPTSMFKNFINTSDSIIKYNQDFIIARQNDL